MCGIVGFQGNTSNNAGIIKEMMSCIKHRGPDDEGELYIDDVSFGHVRLAIIDIEYGKQPMKTPDGRYSIIFNGEIYNYIELRQHLNSKGYKFRTYSDTEVLLTMYVEYNKDLVNYLNGMFAFCIYDNVEKVLFLARDHLGVKPLYFYQDADVFVFGSEIKALLKHPAVKAEMNEKSIHEYLTFQFVMNSNTLFRNIQKLEPASYLVVKNGKIKKQCEYWHLDYQIDESKSQDQFADELLVLLENSLSIQIRSDVPLGAHLSGGIDSSTVSVLAAKNNVNKIKTFTGAFKESELYDETRYAKTVSKFINSDYHTVYPDYKDFIDTFEHLVYHMDEPAAGPGIFPQYMVAKLAAEHVKVVLGGQGGDEVFGGYARYAVAYLEQCLKGAIFETQEEGKHVVTLHSIIQNLPILQKYIPLIKSQFANGLFDDMDRRYFNLVDRSRKLDNIYNADFLASRDKDAQFSRFSQIFNKPDTQSYFNKMTYFDIKTLLPALLHVEDRVSMAVSLESRVPLLDHRIIEFSAGVPPTWKFANGKTKNMLIQAVKNILPEEILNRPDKMGFPVPFNEWIKGPLKEYVLDIFLSKKAKERNIYRTDEIVKFIDRTGLFTREIWGALNLEIWFRQFIDGY